MKRRLEASKQKTATKVSMADALTNASKDNNWLKLTKEVKTEFKKAKSAEVRSFKDGFVLGGSIKQVI
ncbi:MAG: hypothetical protein ACYSR0_09965 [Planctomycetota bacterium]|jgi:hypothetical protein